jgi:chromosomal replication initiation ATPase DnaA
MSILEEFHRAHKTRLRRIASKAVEQVKQPETVVKAEEPKPVNQELEQWVVVQKQKLNEEWPFATYPTVDAIQRATCAHFGVPLMDLLSSRRTAPLIIPRHVAMHLCRRLTPKSYPEIARRFGGRDHTVALWADRKIQKLVNEDAHVCASVEMLIERLGGEMS